MEAGETKASELVKICWKDATLWKLLTSHPTVAEWLKNLLLKELSSGDQGALAQLLLNLIKEKPEKPPALKRSIPDPAWPPRVRRRLHLEQPARCLWMTKGIASLNMNLMATVFSSVDLSTKLSALCVSRGFREILQRASAWDPLVVEKHMCRNMLLVLALQASAFPRTSVSRCRVPEAFYQVSTIDINLMERERHRPYEQSDTEDDQEQVTQLISCPMELFVRSSRGFLANVSKLTIRNVNSMAMKLFYIYRCHTIKAFGFVKIQYTGSGKYCLKATQNDPPFVDAIAGASLNESRIPPTVRRDEDTTISEGEALFLLENPTAYKNGSRFYFIHLDNFDTLNSHTIRKSYKDLLESLKERFPNSFSQL